MESGMRCTQNENIRWADITVYDTMQVVFLTNDASTKGFTYGWGSNNSRKIAVW
ncbi:MAG: hypothetical protein GWP59_05835 [Chlamydiales bacterium]|nr:hypothetical protein [Chlamydiales bacterium]